MRDGEEVPVIPRYFDLLVLLVARRHEAVHRREIFDQVWAGETVSDSALSQAIRTLRRALDDDSREPRFIRTVSRHGYRFVFPDVIEETETAAHPPTHPPIYPSAHPLTLPSAYGGAAAGIVAGGLGGLILALGPGSTTSFAIVPVLAVIGGVCGALGGGGVGAGLEVAARHATGRPMAVVAGAAVGGGAAGLIVQWLTRWSLSALLGVDVPVGGSLEGVVIGTAAGLGCAFAPRTHFWYSVATTGVLCGLAGLVLTLAGLPLVGGTLHAIALSTDGTRAILAPFGRLIGEPDFGPVSRSLLAFGEGATFGVGLAFGLLRRERDDPQNH